MADNNSKMQVLYLDVAIITTNPCQLRKFYNEADLASLSASVKKHGVLEPVRVVKRDVGYELMIGHRRLLAARMAGIEKILAVIQPSGDDQLELAVVENTQRQNLSPLDEAAAFQLLSGEKNYTLQDLSVVTGKSVSSLSETKKLNVIPSDVQDLCRKNDHQKLRFLIELSKFGDEISIRNAYQYYLEFGKLPKRTPRVYGSRDKQKSFLEKLSYVINEFGELDIDTEKDMQFLQQIKEQLDQFNKMLRVNPYY